MELRDFQAFGEPGAIVYLADCVDLMKTMPPESVDMVFADPPYRLSNGGVTVKNGRKVPVDKGVWDRSMGFEADHRFNVGWLREARRILKPDGTIWVTGTHHIIFSLGFALQSMKFKLINQITWAKPDPPPNALHTAFTHLKAVEAMKGSASPIVLASLRWATKRSHWSRAVHTRYRKSWLATPPERGSHPTSCAGPATRLERSSGGKMRGRQGSARRHRW
jgi:hypothetical protein